MKVCSSQTIGHAMISTLSVVALNGASIKAAAAYQEPALLPTTANEAPLIVEHEPIFMAAPIYPVAAMRSGIEGEVTVSFTINAEGLTEDIVVVDSTHDTLNVGAIEAAEKSTFTPRTIDGEASAVRGVTRTYKFQIQDIGGDDLRRDVLAEREGARVDDSWAPIETKAPDFPGRARREGIESGWVLVEYTVTSMGRVVDAVVVESSSPLFEREALRVLRDYRYEPRRVQGLAIDIPKVSRRISFER